MANISGSVGNGGKNLRDDVLVVQTLINHCISLIAPTTTLAVSGTCDQATSDAIAEFQRRVVKLESADGRVDPGGHTFDALSICASGQPYVPDGDAPAAAASATPPGHSGCYTTNPNEVPVQTTTPSAADVVAMLLANWNRLNQQGARTLTAQFMAETGAGKHCYNWNLGNVKTSTDTVPHMYLHGTWELLASGSASGMVATGGGLAHLALDDEMKQHGWSCPIGQSIVVFNPPHPYSRFRAYASLSDGAQRWLGVHQKIGANNPAYLGLLNAGDVGGVAHALKLARYYTATEASYVAGMTRYKGEIDRSLGNA